MLQPYVPILILVVFVIANAVLMLGVSHLLSTYRRTPVKIAPYESGMPAMTGCEGFVTTRMIEPPVKKSRRATPCTTLRTGSWSAVMSALAP